NELVIFIKQIEIWCTSCLIFFSNLLCFIEKIRKPKSMFESKFFHELGSICWILFYIITIDSYKANALYSIIISNTNNFIDYMMYVRTMIANKKYQCTFFAF